MNKKAMVTRCDKEKNYFPKWTICQIVEQDKEGYWIQGTDKYGAINKWLYGFEEVILLDTKADSIVESVIDKFRSRAAIGKIKYNTDMDRNDLSFLEWVEHAQCEAMDMIIYLEKLKSINK